MSISRWKRFTLALGIMLGAVAMSPRASGSIIYSICTSGCTATSGSYSDIQTNSSGLTFSSTISLASAAISGGAYTDPTTGVTFTSDPASTSSSSGIMSGLHGTSAAWTITLPANTYAFGLNLFDPGGFLINLDINGGPMSLDVGTLAGSTAFLGLVSDTAISSITITSGFGLNGAIGLSDFETGIGSGGGGGGGGDTPELSTFLLMGTGLIGLGLVRKRTRMRAVPTKTA